MITESPFFSVLIPCNNVESSILKCLLSIDKQTFRDFECLIVDDGSSDNTAERLRLFCQQKNKYRVIKLSENRGISFARNLLLSISKGQYIIWIDPDDYILPDYFEIAQKLISKNSLDILIFNYHIKIEKETHTFEHKFNNGLLSKENIFLALSYDWYFPSQLWNKIFKKEIFYNVRFPEKALILEDYYVLPSLIKNAQYIYFDSRAFYVYVRRNSSLLCTKTQEKELNQFEIRLDRLKNILEDYPNFFNVGINSLLISLYKSGSVLLQLDPEWKHGPTLKQMLVSSKLYSDHKKTLKQLILLYCYNRYSIKFLSLVLPIIKRSLQRIVLCFMSK